MTHPFNTVLVAIVVARTAAWILAVAMLAGCANAPPRIALPSAEDQSLEARCLRSLASLDALVDAAGAHYAGATRIAAFPYVRVTRLLASYRDEALDDAAFAHWLRLLVAEDRQARSAEFLNLPGASIRSNQQTFAAEGFAGFGETLDMCATALAARDFVSPDNRARLRQAAVVPDDYDERLRVIGLYPLTRIAFAAGMRLYEHGVREAFARSDRPVRGTLVRYMPEEAPLSPSELEAFIAREHANPLGMPTPPAGRDVDYLSLLATHAPVIIVDEADENDRIGDPQWAADGTPRLGDAPTVYTRVTSTRFAGEPRVQLVYAAWFPARPPAWPGDPLAGHLDAVLWRVTLDRDGSPLVYDSIHGCGCYHLFVPTSRVMTKPAARTLDEQALVPAMLPALGPSDRVEIHLESGTHYVRDVRVAATNATRPTRAYAIDFDEMLAFLPARDRPRKSLFGPDGFVAGTERSERFLFWPLGIARAGAMRQWGRHATAFIGRRHFDEPFLLDRYFILRP